MSRIRDIVSGVTTRYRCTACGNLTRFDITLSRRTRAFHHFTVGGELEIEDEEVLSESIDDVSCRWCGSPQSRCTHSRIAVDGLEPVNSIP